MLRIRFPPERVASVHHLMVTGLEREPKVYNYCTPPPPLRSRHFPTNVLIFCMDCFPMSSILLGRGIRLTSLPSRSPSVIFHHTRLTTRGSTPFIETSNKNRGETYYKNTPCVKLSRWRPNGFLSSRRRWSGEQRKADATHNFGRKERPTWDSTRGADSTLSVRQLAH